MSIIAKVNAALPAEKRIKAAGAPTQSALVSLVTEATRISTDAWDRLPDDVQAWLNKAIKAMNNKKPIPLPPDDVNPDKAPPAKPDKSDKPEKQQTELDLDEEISLDDDDEEADEAEEEDDSEMSKKKAKSKEKTKDKAGKGKDKTDKASAKKAGKGKEEAAPKNKKARAVEGPKEPKEKKSKEGKEKAEKPKREKKEKPPKEPRVLKKGGAYYALKYWLADQTLTVETLMEKVKADGVEISKSTLQVLLYDARLVLRVQADLE